MPECFVLGGEVGLVGIDGTYFQFLRNGLNYSCMFPAFKEMNCLKRNPDNDIINSLAIPLQNEDFTFTITTFSQLQQKDT